MSLIFSINLVSPSSQIISSLTKFIESSINIYIFKHIYHKTNSIINAVVLVIHHNYRHLFVYILGETFICLTF